MEKNRFQTYFSNKGILGSIAEKAIHNYKSKIQIGKKIYYHDLYDFTIGHFLKQINRKLYFDFQYDEIDKKDMPTKNLSLLRSRFSFFYKLNDKDIDGLLELIERIRNINAHFIHIFDYIEVNGIQDNVLDLIYDAYKLAVIQIKFRAEIEAFEKEKQRFISIKEKDQLFSTLLKDEGRLIKYLKKLHAIDENESFENLRKLIDHILFIDVNESFYWKLNNNGDGSENNHVHNVLEIKAGKYLSFEGALFILNMFLFRNESNFITGKCSIIKNEDDKTKTDKLRLYIAYSKKFSSQDINPERQNLVQFRDIIQYLTKIPQAWNQFMLSAPYSDLTDSVVKNVIEFEIEKKYKDIIRLYPDFKNYAINYLFEDFGDTSNKNYNLYNDFINKSDEFKKIYLDLLDGKIKRFKRYTFEMYIASYILNEYIDSEDHTYDDIRNATFRRNEEQEFETKFNKNYKLEKLKSRIESKVIMDSYMRNKDKYLQYALRFLLECEYFGKDAQIKMHKYRTMEEQVDEIEHLEEELIFLRKNNSSKYYTNKREFDSLKYHQGKLIVFRTFEEQQSIYPSWRFPFVVQDNSVVIKISDIDMPITIQKDLMVYFMEDALNSENCKGKGEILLKEYSRTLIEERNNILDSMKVQTINTPYKTKILPRRLVKKYNYPTSEKSMQNFYKNLKLKLEADEKKYILKKKIAIEKGVEEEFLRNDKGKSYKFRFIFRAWQIMYFKPKYLEIKGENHHKHYNITKNEFHDLARWMYAFDGNNKINILELARMKGFESHDKIIKLINEAQTFDQLFDKTKNVYNSFLFNLEVKPSLAKYALKHYEEMEIFTKGNINININHFREYLKNSNGNISFNTSVDLAKSVLIESNYISFDDMQFIKTFKNENKCKTSPELKLIEKLRRIKLQDAQLYRIAKHYLLNEDKIKHLDQVNVKDLLNAEFNIEICSGQDIIVPFRLINKYEEIRQSSESLEIGYRGSSILLNFNTFYNKFKNEPSLNSINIAMLGLSDVSKLVNVMVLKQAKFTDIILALEEFYIWKGKVTVDKFNIPIRKIGGLSIYFNEEYKLRNKPFHFNFLADKDYDDEVCKFDNVFYTNEVHSQDITKVSTPVKRVVFKFINQLFNGLNNVTKQELIPYSELPDEVVKEVKKSIILQRYQAKKIKINKSFKV